MKNAILNGETVLGIELGSTRIKSVLTFRNDVIETGSFEWENKLENGFWTYDLEDVWKGLQSSYKDLCTKVFAKYAVKITKLAGIGISAMMHGYLVFDKDDNLLVPFRTWRNTTTEESAVKLTELLNFNIPQRWSITHLHQAILNGEDHVKDISFITTLAGYVHWKLTGEKVLGIGDASGMFPIDSEKNVYDEEMLTKYNLLIGGGANNPSPISKTLASMFNDGEQSTKGYKLSWNLKSILPKILLAGEVGGTLTEDGAKLLDPTGDLISDIPLCPPEGDAGTGMVATNSVSTLTGNISAGTSIFAMIVLEKKLSAVYPEIDIVTTPTGKPVAMVHCNNCTSDIDMWVNLFGENLKLFGVEVDKSTLYETLYKTALSGDKDCGGLLSYNYLSGESITNLEEGRPLLVRTPDSNFNLSNLFRTLLFSTFGTLKLGMDILTEKENVEVQKLLGHGGLFKNKGIAQELMASALFAPIEVMESAGEGGAWGIAILATYMAEKENNESLEDYLNNKVFKNVKGSVLDPNYHYHKSFNLFMEKYINGLEIEKSAIENFK